VFFDSYDFYTIFTRLADAAVFVSREKQMAGKFKIALCNIFQDRAK